MTREGVLRDDVMKDGRYITVELYGMVSPLAIQSLSTESETLSAPVKR